MTELRITKVCPSLLVGSGLIMSIVRSPSTTLLLSSAGSRGSDEIAGGTRYLLK